MISKKNKILLLVLVILLVSISTFSIFTSKNTTKKLLISKADSVTVNNSEEFNNAINSLAGNGGSKTNLTIQLGANIDLSQQTYTIPSGTNVIISGYNSNLATNKPGGYILTKTIGVKDNGASGTFEVAGTLSVENVIFDGNFQQNGGFNSGDPLPFSNELHSTGGVLGGIFFIVYSNGTLNINHGTVILNNESSENSNNINTYNGTIYALGNSTLNIDSRKSDLNSSSTSNKINESNSTIVFTHNDNSYQGGAITIGSEPRSLLSPALNIHGLVNFYQNSSGQGGAISINCGNKSINTNPININIGNSQNDKVLFKENSVTSCNNGTTYSMGGALYWTGYIDLNLGYNNASTIDNNIPNDIDNNNSTVIFTGNAASNTKFIYTKGLNQNNAANYNTHGGAIAGSSDFGSNINIAGTTFYKNIADTTGGGIASYGEFINQNNVQKSGNITLNNVLIANNTANGSTNSSNTNPSGGGMIFTNIFGATGDLTINNSQIIGNQANITQLMSFGGGITYNTQSTSTSSSLKLGGKTIFAGNYAQAGGGLALIGSGINAYIGDVNSPLDNIAFDRNIAGAGYNNNSQYNFGAGIYYSNINTLNVNSTSFTNNSANDSVGMGGAIGTGFGSSSTTINVNSCKVGTVNSNLDNYSYQDYNYQSHTIADGGNYAGDYGGGFWFVGSGAGSNEPITITDTNFDNNNSAAGGAIVLDNLDSTKISNCNFTTNKATLLSGGAIAKIIGASQFTINNCNFNGNQAVNNGGAISLDVNYYTAQNHTINNSTFKNNTAINGGAISKQNNNDTITINNSTLDSNNASNSGGAIYNTSGSGGFNINNNSTISTNTANLGGGIYSDLNITTFNIDNSKISNNVATNNGGGIYLYSNNNLTINGTITGNSATNNGGGVYLYSCNNINIASNLNDNKAILGAGAYIEGKNNPINVNFNSAKITGNKASTSGGGIYYTDSANTTSKININTDTLLQNNNAVNNGGAIYLDQGLLKNLFVTSGTTFNQNTAGSYSKIVNFPDQTTYQSNIQNTNWSTTPNTPLPYKAQGYNNYDIAYPTNITGQTTLRAVPNFDFGINSINSQPNFNLVNSKNSIPDPTTDPNSKLNIALNDTSTSTTQNFLGNKYRALIVTNSGQNSSNHWLIEAALSKFKNKDNSDTNYSGSNPPSLTFNSSNQNTRGINDDSSSGTTYSQYTYGGDPKYYSKTLISNGSSQTIMDSGNPTAVGSWALDFGKQNSVELYFPDSIVRHDSTGSGTYSATVTWTVISSTPST